MITFVTSARPIGAAIVGGARAVLEVTSNVRLFSFGLPLLAAMILAAREPHPLRNLAIGYGVMVPFQTFSVIADFLKNLVGVPGVAAQLGVSPWQREADRLQLPVRHVDPADGRAGGLLGAAASTLSGRLREWRAIEATTESDYPVPDAFLSSRSRSTRRCTLPVVVIGSASMNSMSFGYS